MSTAAIALRLRQWPRGALHLGEPLPAGAREALERAVGRALPADYLALLERFDGLDLRGDRLLDVGEVLERFAGLEGLLDEIGCEAWARLGRRERVEQARALVPVAADAEGNLKCLDLAVGDVVDLHLESGAVTGWAHSVTAMIEVALDALELRFDPKGRPRRLKAGEAALLERRELELHVARSPTSAWANLELARWHSRASAPELALECWRRAGAVSDHPRIHHEHGLFAADRGRYREARAALRRALSDVRPQGLRHVLGPATRASAHALLAELYRQVGQLKKGTEQARVAEQLRKHGADGVDDDVEAVLARVRRAAAPTVALGQLEAQPRRRDDDAPDLRSRLPDGIAFPITHDDDLDPGEPSDPDSGTWDGWGEEDT